MIQIFLMFIHWIGDYVFQTGDMARYKSKSFYWLTIHVLAYTSALVLGSLILYFVLDIKLVNVSVFILVNAVLHWLTDSITSRLAAKFKEKSDKLYYCTLGFDQFIHAACLISTYEYLLNLT